MAPGPTLAEVARILRPGGVFAVIDADWPPVTGVAGAEQAWATVHRRLRVFDARTARGETGAELRRPVAADDLARAHDDLADPHRDRALPEGVRSWAKHEHLARMAASGAFWFTRELLFNHPVDGGADRFVALLHSQGSYQTLRRLGLSDEDLGTAAFEAEVRRAFAAAPGTPAMSFSWRVRLGVTAPGANR
jgi:SAM-dependent methyltransferase